MKRTLFLLAIGLVLMVFAETPAWADEITLAQITQAGSMAQIPLEIHNETAVDHAYQLAMTGLPDTLTATFVQDGPVLASVNIAANDFGHVTLRVQTAPDTPVGHTVATFSATRDDGRILTHPVSLQVENTYALRIVGQPANINAFSGQEFTFETTAANTGAAPVTNLALKVDAPAKWVVQLDPPTVDKLEPGASVNITAHAMAPASQVSIDQPLSLSVTSDQAVSPESALSVRVQKRPNYLIAAGALIGLAIAGLFLYFRTKGRR